MKLPQRYMTMTEMALEALRGAILTGELPPNSHLVPAKLATEMNLSQEAIRDAIRQLSGTGLVKTITNRGSFIGSPPDLEELKEIFRLRSVIEPVLAAKAVEKINEEELEQLRALHRQMEEAFKKSSTSDYFLLNREFHLTLYRASQWEHVCHTVTQWLDDVMLFRINYCVSGKGTGMRVFNDEHQQIISAIESKNPTALKTIVEKNLHSGLNNIVNNYSENKLIDRKKTSRPQ